MHRGGSIRRIVSAGPADIGGTCDFVRNTTPALAASATDEEKVRVAWIEVATVDWVLMYTVWLVEVLAYCCREG